MSQADDQQKGQNIKVVLRCRPMTPSEATKDKGAIKCVSDKHVEVNCQAMGKSSKKTFAFDGVYDEKSTQKQVYDSVVRPVVDEVLQGYNCTVFAYGQTGTGKTHTMEGDVTQAPGGVMQPNAGIIPRAVTQVFKYLDENEFEYTVRISVVELYNEELSDLIASADDGSTAGSLRKLRLMEDPKKGIVLQGVEERACKDAKDIFNLLEGTNKQRRTAETLCNKQSSRSHQIFTLKIFMKEKTLEEEEIIKTGTLNLVDLAGSECVGRSGALGDRKKEAGQINQSLLTLGRVITALVEHQPHVPYRESKLTRLLQESLGGKTKTCIIATVSPTSGNIEETLGTLDYACRAKNIKNTPEINQVQTKKTMMRDMSKYIADLQEQLKCQRDGSGVYLPTQRYEEMQAELKRLTDAEVLLLHELDEKTKQYQELQEAFEDTCVLLDGTRSDLRQTQGTLRDTEEQRDAAKATLRTTERRLLCTNAVLSEHKHVGNELYAEGSALLQEAECMKKEMGGLFSKIARKGEVETANARIASSYVMDLYQHVDEAGRELEAFHADQEGKFKRLQRLVAELVVEKNSEMEGLKRAVAEVQASMQELLAQQAHRVVAAAETAKMSLGDLELLAAEQGEEEVACVRACAGQVRSTCADTAAQLEAADEGISNWAHRILGGLSEGEQVVHSFVASHKSKLQAIAEQVKADSAARQEAILADREALEFMVSAQAAASQEMQQQLAQQMQALLQQELAKHQQSMANKVQGIAEGLSKTAASMRESEHTTTDAISSSIQAVDTLASTHASHAAGERAACQQELGLAACNMRALSVLNADAKRAVAECQESVERLRAQHEQAVKVCVEESAGAGAEVAGAACESLAAESDALVKATESVLEMLQLSDASANARGDALSGALEEQALAADTLLASSHAQMRAMRARELALRADVPTGETPQKRALPLPPALPAFRSDAVVLADLRLALDDEDTSEAAGQACEAGGAQEKDERGAGSEMSVVKSAEAACKPAAAAPPEDQQCKQQPDGAAAGGGEAEEEDSCHGSSSETPPSQAAAKSPSKLKEVARPRSARGTGPKELVAAVAGGKIVSSSSSANTRIPSVRSSQNKENTRNIA